jgi:DNA-directed RNA polymerase specialized sigma24 family protein
LWRPTSRRSAGGDRRRAARLIIDHRLSRADDEVLRGELRREVWEALARLSTDSRTALLLAAHGFSGRDIAEALGRSELATRSLICRARLRLREQLGESEVST